MNGNSNGDRNRVGWWVSGLLGALLVGILIPMFTRDREAMTEGRVREIVVEQLKPLVVEIKTAKAAAKESSRATEKVNDQLTAVSGQFHQLVGRLSAIVDSQERRR